MKNKNIIIFLVATVLVATLCVFGFIIYSKNEKSKYKEISQLSNLTRQQELQNETEQKKKQQEISSDQVRKSPSAEMDYKNNNNSNQDVEIEGDTTEFLAGTGNLKEGEEFNGGFDNKIKNECASGLIPVVAAEEFRDGDCGFPMCSCYVCTKCGDGICGKGENFCNCPKDCEKGEGKNDNNEDMFDFQVYESEE